jgi:hypothetical protein
MSKKKVITEDQVSKALEDLEATLTEPSEDVSKASEDDLDQPEGADLGNPAKEKMSDAAKAKKAKKALPPVGEDDGDEDEPEMEKKMPAKKAAKKSFAEEAPEEIQTKIDVSEFLKSLVDHTGNTIESLREEVSKSEAQSMARYDDLSQAVEDVQKSQAKIGIVLKAICEKIGVIAGAPARVAKSDTVAKSEGAPAPAARSFDSGLAEEKPEKVFKSLSDKPLEAKAQISNALCDMVRKGEAKDLDVIGFETSGYISPDLVSKLKQVLN